MEKAKDELRQPNNDVKSPVIHLKGINRFLLCLKFDCLWHILTINDLCLCPSKFFRFCHL